MSNAKLISIEGIEGAGKTTVMEYLKKYFTQHALPFCVTREPGGTPLAEEIRQVLLHPISTETMSHETELLLMFAARAQHVQQVVQPALQQQKWVLCDRYIDATYAYQGGGRGIDLEKIQNLDQWIVADHYPGLTLLMDIHPVLGLERTRQRAGHSDRIEQEKAVFFSRVRATYLARAQADPKRIKVIDASLDLPDVLTQVHAQLDMYCLGVS